MFGIEICSYSRYTGRSGNDRYCELSATFKKVLRVCFKKHLRAMIVWLSTIELSSPDQNASE
jgi:hypothetical protein